MIATASQYEAASITGGDGAAITNADGSITIDVDLSTDGNGSGLEIDAGDSNKLQAKVDGTTVEINASGELAVNFLAGSDPSSPGNVTGVPRIYKEAWTSGVVGGF